MSDYNHEIDGDDASEEFFVDSEETTTDQLPFLDYGNDGNWVIGILDPNLSVETCVQEIIDSDPDINTLVKRAVNDWGIDPLELLVSPCAKEIATLTLTTGRRI